jgi:hypothetical protein
VALAAGPVAEPVAAAPAAPATRGRDRGPRLDLERVEAFVRAAHTDLDRTRQLLDEEPALVNAAWDWGGGDWETALGGASHMGRPDVARLLLRRGARMDVFCAAMLGEAALVASFLDFDPRVVALAGPHGIPLLRHAEAGGSREVWDLLVARGAEAPPREVEAGRCETHRPQRDQAKAGSSSRSSIGTKGRSASPT